MSWTSENPRSRAITIIALIQAGVIIGGTLFVTVMSKAIIDGGYPINPVALFVRRFGFTLLFLPIVWVLLAIYIQTRERTRPLLHLGILVVGIGAIVWAIWAYMHLAFSLW